MRLTSLQNPRVKAAVRLRDRRGREEAGRMLVEGYHELSLALTSGVRPVELFFCPEEARNEEIPLLHRLQETGTEILEVTPAVMRKLAYREHPDAWLAVAPLPACRLADLSLGPAPLLVVAEACAPRPEAADRYGPLQAWRESATHSASHLLPGNA